MFIQQNRLVFVTGRFVFRRDAAGMGEDFALGKYISVVLYYRI